MSYVIKYCILDDKKHFDYTKCATQDVLLANKLSKVKKYRKICFSKVKHLPLHRNQW